MAKPKAYGPGITTQRLSECMKEKRITQVALADTLGKAPQTICRWVNGKTNIGAADLERLAEILDTTTDYLRGHSNIKNRAAQLQFDEQEAAFMAEFVHEWAGLDEWAKERRRLHRTLNCFFKAVCGYTYAEESSAAVDFGGTAPHIFKAQDGKEFRVSEKDFQTMLQRIREAVDFACLKSAQQNSCTQKEGTV